MWAFNFRHHRSWDRSIICRMTQMCDAKARRDCGSPLQKADAVRRMFQVVSRSEHETHSTIRLAHGNLQKPKSLRRVPRYKAISKTCY